MNIAIASRPLGQIDTDALLVLVSEGIREERFGAGALFESKEIQGKPLELTLLHHPPEVAAPRVLLIGTGKREKFDTAELRKAIAAAARYLKAKSIKHIALSLEPELTGEAWVRAAVEGAILGNFEPDRYRTDEDKKSLASFTIVGAAGASGLEQAAEQGRILAEAQNFTRELVNEPGNRLTPSKIAEAARQLAADFGLACEVIERSQMEALGMGALLGVAQGSAEPPALVIIRYQPSNARPGVHLGLVGKGVTFDTGGISLKPAENMEQMKYDMAGGASMLGAMRALAQLKPPIQVSAFIPCVENMPGSRAQRPGDIVTAMSGKTIEVINTDAEGRLILADGVFYARKLGCTHLIDAATLTGAIEVALSNVHVGAFGTPREYLDEFLQSAKATGEKMWPMPIDEEYQQMIKSDIADIRNTGSGKGGGASTAAWFIKEFVDDTPWVHLDIASTCWADEGRPWLAKGPTGVAIRSIIDFALKL
jgi:leucyl aminopeptidase